MNPNLQRILSAANKRRFSPLDIPNLFLWLDSTDSSTLFADVAGTTPATSTVGLWKDKSGNARDYSQGTLSSRPTTGIRVHNGLNVIDFSGTNNLVAPSSMYSFPNGVTTAFSVGATDTTGDGHFIAFTATSRRYALGWSGGATNAYRGWHGLDGASATSNIGPIGAGTAVIQFQRAITTTYNLYLNGGSPGTTRNVTTFTATAGFLGSLAAASERMNGFIGETLLYNRSLTVLETNKILTYLGDRWNIAYTPIS